MSFMRNVLYIAVALLTPTSLVSQVVTFSERDELEGTKTHWVLIRSERYKPFSWEEEISIRCYPTGKLWLNWHRGGRFSGWYVGDSNEVVYKFEQGELVRRTFKGISQDRPDVKEFVKNLEKSSLLTMKVSTDAASTRFYLKGSASAFKAFHGQCL